MLATEPGAAAAFKAVSALAASTSSHAEQVMAGRKIRNIVP